MAGAGKAAKLGGWAAAFTGGSALLTFLKAVLDQFGGI
jgi:hypothetical protein